MVSPSAVRYLAVILTAITLTMVLAPIASMVSVRLGFVGMAIDGRRTPLLGGLAIYAGSATAISLFGGRARGQLAVLLLVGLVVVTVGVVDDWRSLGVWKLLPELVAAVTLVLTVSKLRLTGVAAIDALASVVFVVVVINAVGHTDVANGLCSGLVAASCGGFFIVGVATQRYSVAVGAAAIGAACIGFLPMNYPTGRLFLGHSGSLFLGLAVAFFVLRLDLEVHALWVRLLVPMLLVAVPLFDLTLVVTARFLRNVGPMSAVASDHMHHRLVGLGLASAAATATLWLVQAGFALLVGFVARR